MTYRLSLLSRSRRALWAAPLALTTALTLTGCGGVGNTNSARIRSVDAATDALTSNILINGSSAYGDQTYFTASPYLYIATGTSLFSYTTTASITQKPQTTTQTLSTGQFYTAYLVGRADTTSDASFLHVVVTNDSKPAIPSGQIAVRVLQGAADAGPVNVDVNGTTLVTNADFQSVSAYQTIPAGSSISVTVATAGTSNVIVPATSLPVQAGKAYTIVVTEPTGGTAATAISAATPPTYSVQETAE